MTIAQEEIFGPVLSIIPYDDEEDAIRIANDTLYGLAGGVWSADEERAQRGRPSHADRSGRRQRRQLQPRWPPSVATSSPASVASWARYGLEEFLEVKSMQLND